LVQPFTSAQLRSRILAAQTFQNDRIFFSDECRCRVAGFETNITEWKIHGE